MTETIKPCPFCKSMLRMYAMTLDNVHIFVKCRTCGAQGPDARTEESAVALWNAASNALEEARRIAVLRLTDCETMATEVERYKTERDEHLAKRKELHQFARDCTMQIDVLLSMREALFASIASLNKERDTLLEERSKNIRSRTVDMLQGRVDVLEAERDEALAKLNVAVAQCDEAIAKHAKSFQSFRAWKRAAETTQLKLDEARTIARRLWRANQAPRAIDCPKCNGRQRIYLDNGMTITCPNCRGLGKVTK